MVDQNKFKQLNLTFKRVEYDNIVGLVKELGLTSVSGFVKECAYEGMDKVISRKKHVIDMLKGKKKSEPINYETVLSTEQDE